MMRFVMAAGLSLLATGAIAAEPQGDARKTDVGAEQVTCRMLAGPGSDWKTVKTCAPEADWRRYDRAFPKRKLYNNFYGRGGV